MTNNPTIKSELERKDMPNREWRPFCNNYLDNNFVYPPRDKMIEIMDPAQRVFNVIVSQLPQSTQVYSWLWRELDDK